jgi:hypothetical protein
MQVTSQIALIYIYIYCFFLFIYIYIYIYKEKETIGGTCLVSGLVHLVSCIQGLNKGFKFGVLHETYIVGTWKTSKHLHVDRGKYEKRSDGGPPVYILTSSLQLNGRIHIPQMFIDNHNITCQKRNSFCESSY